MDSILNGFISMAALVLKLMVFELLIGAGVGVIKKEAARLQAGVTPTKRVIPAREYTSAVFGRNLPRGFFNLLALAPEFVVVEYNGDEIRKETFYTPLGDHTSMVNGQVGSSILDSPIYVCTIVLPMLLGFIASILLFWLSPVNQYAPAYLISGLGWSMIATLIPLLIHQVNNGGNAPE